MRGILANPCLENFLRNCKAFAIQSGLASTRVKELIDDAEKAGAIGASQNMIGEAVHAIVKDTNLKKVHEAFKSYLSEEKIVVSRDTILRILSSKKKPLICAGTTSLRTIESLYWLGVKIIRERFNDEEFREYFYKIVSEDIEKIGQTKIRGAARAACRRR
jgi:nitrogen regulatory protein PII-like uncharacterized protein